MDRCQLLEPELVRAHRHVTRPCCRIQRYGPDGRARSDLKLNLAVPFPNADHILGAPRIFGHGTEGDAEIGLRELRGLADAVVLFVLANRFTHGSDATTKRVVLGLTGILFILGPALHGVGTPAKGLISLLALAAFAVLSWSTLLAGEDRRIVSNGLKTLKLI